MVGGIGRALFVFYPDRLEYGLRLVAAEVVTALAGAEAAGHAEQAAAARLALGRLDLARGRREAGLARLAALEREARARGLLLIARQAQSG